MRQASGIRAWLRRLAVLAGVALPLAPLFVATTYGDGANSGVARPAATYLSDNPTPRPPDAHFAERLRLLNAYPGPVSGMLLPDGWIGRQLADRNPLKRLAAAAVLGPPKARTMAGFYAWLGPTPMAEATQSGDGGPVVGANTIDTEWGRAFTFGCAACHSQNFFGTLVLGMGNKAPHANMLFWYAKEFVQNAPLAILQPGDAAEAALLKRTQTRLAAIGVKRPMALGLDTSFAQVSLSLAHRDTDPLASLSAYYSAHPRPDAFDTAVADSKPMNWWAVRYKDRWLADGSMVKGDVVATNVLWNEIGRGTDLGELDAWIAANPSVLAGLRKLVMSAVPPRIEDFVDGAIDLPAARRGEKSFLARCSGCHGVYAKDWASGTHTVAVNYPRPTRVRNVGTDPNRAEGMTMLAQRLNRLDFSRKRGLAFATTGGYVPPPLIGIWSRYPYLHNGSVPNLCEMLTPPEERVKRYYVGTTEDVLTDFDRACIGYPVRRVPERWKVRDRLFDTNWPGLSNQGHPFFTDAAESDKRDLIEFLKTL